MHPAPPPPLNPLQRFIGSWRGEVLVDTVGTEPQRYVQDNTWAWTLGGSFLEERGTASNGSSFVGLWSAAGESGKYRAYYFVAPTGDVVMLTQEWNERDQSFGGSADLGGGVLMKAEDRFLDSDTYEWSLTVVDGAGKVLSRTRAREHRVKT